MKNVKKIKSSLVFKSAITSFFTAVKGSIQILLTLDEKHNLCTIFNKKQDLFFLFI